MHQNPSMVPVEYLILTKNRICSPAYPDGEERVVVHSIFQKLSRRLFVYTDTAQLAVMDFAFRDCGVRVGRCEFDAEFCVGEDVAVLEMAETVTGK